MLWEPNIVLVVSRRAACGQIVFGLGGDITLVWPGLCNQNQICASG